MSNSPPTPDTGLLLLVAGAKGAIGSTLAAATVALATEPQPVLNALTTTEKFPYLGPATQIAMAGWDTDPREMVDVLASHRVLPERLWQPRAGALNKIPVRPAPPTADGRNQLDQQVEQLVADMAAFKTTYKNYKPVLVNLLPAAPMAAIRNCTTLAALRQTYRPREQPDIAYALAAVQAGIPVVNFTPNSIEIPAVVTLAEENGVALCGRDGKTGQTYFKVVLASAFKARSLTVDGWYSLNILGNADGENLMDPECAAGKLANKTDLLDDLLGYRVGGRHGAGAHKVHIDYYPPRGDAKEAWDVIDFQGLFGLPMSLRLNLQGRDSILAAPMAIDLSRWMLAVQGAGRKGLIGELGFFFKLPVGRDQSKTFQNQLARLEQLEQACDAAWAP